MVLHSNILAQKIPRQKSLAGYSPWGRKELDMTQQLNNNKNFTRWFDRKQQNSVKQLSVNKKYILKKISKKHNLQQKVGKEKKKRLYQMGFLWWSRGEESTCQCREHGFNPWSRKIPHAVEQLSPCATTAEPECHNKRNHCNEKPAHVNKEQLLLAATRESPRTAAKTQCSPTNKQYNHTNVYKTPFKKERLHKTNKN